MGKRSIILSLFLVITLVCTIIFIPLSGSGQEVEAANPAPWADIYGFNYFYDGFRSAKGEVGYSFGHHQSCNFSGTEEWWNWDYPCTNLSLCSQGWPATIYYNKPASKAKENLPGNAIFAFFGHGNYSSITFYSGLQKSYITSGDILWLSGDLDDLKFVYLNSCSSLDGSASIGMRFRQRGADIVFGYHSDVDWRQTWSVPGHPGVIYTYPSHVYNQELWRAIMMFDNTNVQSAMAWAIYWVQWHCNDTGGLESHGILGAENDWPINYVRWIGDGRDEI